MTNAQEREQRIQAIADVLIEDMRLWQESRHRAVMEGRFIPTTHLCRCCEEEMEKEREE
jgi:hypothetical protein